ncbi:hypothetical protein [Avibacterium paragallinarum]|uniref:hypothetical protein n=1 Tax=Avibacterium paragallinarum TaxID=728 RepID=UPI0039879BCE
MNYRVLFITAFLVLIVGVAGILFYVPDDSVQSQASSEPVSTEEVKAEPVVVDEQQTILLVKANRNIKRGEILREYDITLSEKSISGNDEMLQNDFSELLKEGKTLRSFAVTQDIVKEGYLSPQIVVSPEDERFLNYTVNPQAEVAYSLCIHSLDSDSLTTLKVGDNVALYAFTPNETRKVKFVPLFNSVQLLQVQKTPVDEENKGATQTCAFTTRVKLHTEQVKKMYAIQLDSRLLLLPTDSEQPSQHRGSFIRTLRGN